jgi:hypothetical protein
MSDIPRRSFFGRAIAAIAGLIGLGVLIPAGGYTILPAFKKLEESWSEAGTLDKLAINHPKELEIITTTSSGWMKANSVRSVWGFRKPEGEAGISKEGEI